MGSCAILPGNLFGSIPQGLACFQSMGHAFLSLALSTEADKRFTFKVENILLGNDLGRRNSASGQNKRKFPRDYAIIFAGVFSANEHVNRQLRSGKKFFSEHSDLGGRRRMVSSADHGQRSMFCV